MTPSLLHNEVAKFTYYSFSNLETRIIKMAETGLDAVRWTPDILVVGHTQQLEGDMNKKATFEMFWCNLPNPEIIT